MTMGRERRISTGNIIALSSQKSHPPCLLWLLLSVKPLALSQTQILYSSKLKEFADNNFKFDENGRRFYKQVDNIVGKGEIALSEQFLLFL